MSREEVVDGFFNGFVVMKVRNSKILVSYVRSNRTCLNLVTCDKIIDTKEVFTRPGDTCR